MPSSSSKVSIAMSFLRYQKSEGVRDCGSKQIPARKICTYREGQIAAANTRMAEMDTEAGRMRGQLRPPHQIKTKKLDAHIAENGNKRQLLLEFLIRSCLSYFPKESTASNFKRSYKVLTLLPLLVKCNIAPLN